MMMTRQWPFPPKDVSGGSVRVNCNGCIVVTARTSYSGALRKTNLNQIAGQIITGRNVEKLS